jgi:hypothetical protein
MAFGQQSGLPASAKQVKELLTLLKNVGHSDFRDARGPMGFTQRQAAGKFTRDEAAAFIDRLRDTESGGSAPLGGQWRGCPRKSRCCATCLSSSSPSSFGVAAGP